MKKRNGFTLVELLAVIVVLALIMIIAIPSILNTTNAAKKESFYLYAQSLESKAVSKYTQDLEYDKDNTECAVYDISKDLDIANTGNYEGWVKVLRQPSSTGKQNYVIELSNAAGLEYVNYCTVSAEKRDCTPDKSMSFPEGSKTVKVTQTLKAGSTLCANYQYASNGSLVKSATKCIYQGDSVDGTFDYKVYVTLKSGDYAVQNIQMNEEMSMEKFYKEIDNFKSEVSGLAIKSPSCDASDPSEIKGTTTTKVQNVNTTTTEGKSEQVVSTNSTTTRNVQYESTTTTSRRVVGEDVTTTTQKGEQIITTTVKTEPVTEEITTTTINVQDTTLLLNTLNISGFDIGFSPLKFYYEMDVPYETTSLSVSADPVTPDVTTVVISGHEALNVGRNIVIVGLSSSQSGQSSYYRIIVNRYDEFGNSVVSQSTTTTKPYNPEEGAPDPTIEASDASLKYIKISGYPIEFSKDTYEYTVQVANPDNLKIFYEPNNPYAIATLEGDKDLHNGGEIIITVVSQNKYYSKKYRVKIVSENKTSSGTKILRGVAVGLGVVLAGILSVIGINKAKAKKMVKNSVNNAAKDNIINPTAINRTSGVHNVFESPTKNQLPTTPDNSNDTESKPQ